MRRWAGWGEAACECRIEMVMGVDQPRHDQAAAGIDSAVRSVRARGNLTDLDDLVAFDVNTTALDEAIVFIEGYQVSIGDQQ